MLVNQWTHEGHESVFSTAVGFHIRRNDDAFGADIEVPDSVAVQVRHGLGESTDAVAHQLRRERTPVGSKLGQSRAFEGLTDYYDDVREFMLLRFV
jgi:hypothetical protein